MSSADGNRANRDRRFGPAKAAGMFIKEFFSGVARTLILRLKEGGQQTIYLQQSSPCQLHPVIRQGQVARLGELVEAFREIVEDIGSKLAFEIGTVEP